ncbi:MAG: chorismate-binding protein, partial [Candidatus Nealsonbacteria bacterium]|nr:chorismate-binding protein [Candidatus Nealsonbacteria bacterium]
MKVITQFEKKPLIFSEPEFIISCVDPCLLAGCFEDMESALRGGYYLAGFLSYEAGYCFEEKLRKDKLYDFPLIHFGVYKASGESKAGSLKPSSPSYPSKLRLNITQDKYFSDINTIRDYIAKGDVYQITYCLKLLFEFYGDPFSFYTQLLKEQPVPYPAYIETEKFHILS